MELEVYTVIRLSVNLMVKVRVISKIPDRVRNCLGHFGLFWPRPVEEWAGRMLSGVGGG
jgi:hypothetical protein